MINGYILTIIITTIALLIGASCAITMISDGVADDDGISFYMGFTFMVIYLIQCWWIAPYVEDVLDQQ
jgi:hypothetical protein